MLEEQSATELHLEDAQRLNEEYFNEEQEKLERWAEDSKEAIQQELNRQQNDIRDAKKGCLRPENTGGKNNRRAPSQKARKGA